MSAVRKKVQRPRPRPDHPNPTPRGVLYRAMKNHPYFRVLVALAAAAILAFIANSQAGCATKPTAPPVATPTPAPSDPAPVPPPDVGADCSAKIQSMQTAVGIAKFGARLLTSRQPEYKVAVDIALAAIDAALEEAQAQCGAADVDGWAIALAAFDRAFAELVDAGELDAKSALPDEFIPPYVNSLEEWNFRVFEAEYEPRYIDVVVE